MAKTIDPLGAEVFPRQSEPEVQASMGHFAEPDQAPQLSARRSVVEREAGSLSNQPVFWTEPPQGTGRLAEFRQWARDKRQDFIIDTKDEWAYWRDNPGFIRSLGIQIKYDLQDAYYATEDWLASQREGLRRRRLGAVVLGRQLQNGWKSHQEAVRTGYSPRHKVESQRLANLAGVSSGLRNSGIGLYGTISRQFGRAGDYMATKDREKLASGAGLLGVLGVIAAAVYMAKYGPGGAPVLEISGPPSPKAQSYEPQIMLDLRPASQPVSTKGIGVLAEGQTIWSEAGDQAAAHGYQLDPSKPQDIIIHDALKDELLRRNPAEAARANSLLVGTELEMLRPRRIAAIFSKYRS